MSETAGGLRLSSRRQHGTAIVTVSGELDIATAGELLAYARDALRRAPRRLILELGGVSFFSAAGVGVLVALAAAASRQGTELLLGETSPAVTRVLRLLGLHDHYPSARSAPLPQSPQPDGGEPDGGRAGAFAAAYSSVIHEAAAALCRPGL